MNAVLKPGSIEKGPDQGFSESQKLALEKRGMTFEALFYRQLQQVTARIHETENIEQIMLEASPDICKLFNADRLTLYAVSDDKTGIVSKVKTGLNSTSDIKLPITPQSLAGYAAFSGKLINLADVYDEAALKQIHPALTFLKAVDKRSGYRIILAPGIPTFISCSQYSMVSPFGSLTLHSRLSRSQAKASVMPCIFPEGVV